MIVVEDEPKIKKLLEMSNEMPSLKHIVAMKHEAITGEVEDLARNTKIRLHKFYELVQFGLKNAQKDVPPKPDDTFIIW